MFFKRIEGVDRYIPILKQMTHGNAQQNVKEILEPVLHCLLCLGRDGFGSVWGFFERLIHVQLSACGELDDFLCWKRIETV